ncbi:MAG: HAD-IA family hydrolase [Dehalococcoidia bacterium]|nr:HAD-IA family hydrolase [Dehalococcoidia bacterium]
MEIPHLDVPTEDQSLGYCFGCGEHNPIGLHLKPFYDGERVTASFIPEYNHQGWHHVTHGGILYTVLDEITAYVVLCSGFSFGVTAKSSIRFRRPSATNEPLIVTAWPTKVTSRLIEVNGRLATMDGSVIAEVESSFIPAGKSPRAFLWDMDGVIVDSGAAHYQSWREAFASRGAAFTDEQFRAFFGTRDDLIIGKVLGPLAAEEVRAIEDEKEQRYRALVRGKARILPGVVPLLEAMKKNGFRIALGTSAPMANVDAVMPELGLSRYFDAVVCGEDVSEGKPSPQIYLLAAEKLHADPAQCVVFEDSPHGVEAAKRGGMKCVAVTNSHPAAALAAADRVVSSMEEIDLVQLIRWI